MPGRFEPLSRGRNRHERGGEAATERIEAAPLDHQRAVLFDALEGRNESGQRVFAVQEVEKERARRTQHARDLAQHAQILLVGFEIAEGRKEAHNRVERAASQGQRAHLGARLTNHSGRNGPSRQ